jgi:uncharacterized protein
MVTRPDSRPMVEVDTVLLKVASRCNIDCRYCYVYNMGDTGWSRGPKLMSSETCSASARALARLAREQERPFALVLHGGEPLLLGTARLEQVFLTLREVLPFNYEISIQTNGILISREILDLCAAARVSLSVSLDGPRHVHDRNRVGFSGEGTFAKVLEGIERLRVHPDSTFLFTGCLAVIDPKSDPGEVYRFFKGLRPPSIDFIYKDGNHSRLPKGKASALSTEYGQWMAALFDVYLSDDSPIRIRILDDMMKLIIGGAGSKEGVGLTNYGIVVIDTDGSVRKNDTLKSSFDGADRFTAAWSVHTHSLSDILKSLEFAEYEAMQRPRNPTCLACPELSVCGGGMTLHRWRDGSGYDNPAVYCEDQKLLISHIRKEFTALRVIG